jgi:hypothetical protein
MFEYKYEVELAVIHRTMHHDSITKVLKMTPTVYSTSGEELHSPLGVRRGRRARLSCWIAPLHSQPRIDSVNRELGDFLAEWVDRLRPHAQLFLRIADEGGEVLFRIGYHCVEEYSTSVLACKVLKGCGEIGIGLEINCIVSATNQ